MRGVAPVGRVALACAIAWVAASAAAQGVDPSAPRVLVTEVQGSPEVREAYTARLRGSIDDALRARGYGVVTEAALGHELVACTALECTERVLASADASFGLVPAIWARDGGRRELTLTLVGKSGRNLNAGTVLNGDLSSTTELLVDRLLARHARTGPDGAAVSNEALAVPTVGGSIAGASLDLQGTRDRPTPKRSAWKAGPIILWTAAGVTLISMGTVIRMRGPDERVNQAAVIGWSVVAAAAIAGGTAWWIVGQRRRRETNATQTETAVGVSPGGFDLRLRF